MHDLLIRKRSSHSKSRRPFFDFYIPVYLVAMHMYVRSLHSPGTRLRQDSAVLVCNLYADKVHCQPPIGDCSELQGKVYIYSEAFVYFSAASIT